ncbi:hypothetical protein BC834DRAFT_541233 [Gloeopeniophorella convolvens]|nr:hypothetical protein BC834DRAFT_541233 [Gloeopeniophorella convolvens]
MLKADAGRGRMLCTFCRRFLLLPQDPARASRSGQRPMRGTMSDPPASYGALPHAQRSSASLETWTTELHLPSALRRAANLPQPHAHTYLGCGLVLPFAAHPLQLSLFGTLSSVPGLLELLPLTFRLAAASMPRLTDLFPHHRSASTPTPRRPPAHYQHGDAPGAPSGNIDGISLPLSCAAGAGVGPTFVAEGYRSLPPTLRSTTPLFLV